MKTNIGKIDRGLRITAGLGLFTLLFVLDKPLSYIGLFGVVPITTAILGYCPAYRLVGLSTCSIKSDKH